MSLNVEITAEINIRLQLFAPSFLKEVKKPVTDLRVTCQNVERVKREKYNVPEYF